MTDNTPLRAFRIDPASYPKRPVFGTGHKTLSVGAFRDVMTTSGFPERAKAGDDTRLTHEATGETYMLRALADTDADGVTTWEVLGHIEGTDESYNYCQVWPDVDQYVADTLAKIDAIQERRKDDAE